MKRNKKVLSIIILLCMVIQFLGCKPNTNTSDFDEFINNVHLELIDSEDFSLDHFFKDKTALGFDDVDGRVKFSTREDYAKQMVVYQKILEQLHNFNYYQLSDKQKLNYDILNDLLKTFLVLKDEYIYYNTYISPFAFYFTYSIEHVNELQFTKKKDYEIYLQIIKETINSFDDVYDLCKYQIPNNLISGEDVESIIDSCNENIFDISIEEKIKDTTLFTDEEKTQYLNKYNKLIREFRPLTVTTQNKIQKLYDTYKSELNNENKNMVSELAKSNKGREHYKKIVQSYLGTQVVSIEQLEAELKISAAKTKFKLDKLCKETGLKPSYESYDENLKFSNFTNNKDAMDFLESSYSEHFPKLPKINYTINEIDLPLGVAGQFALGRIDDPLNNLDIYMPKVYMQNSFSTLAHEGFPGHMYQSVYNNLKDAPLINKYWGNLAYDEGWADYIQRYILNYLPIEDNRPATIRTLSKDYQVYNRCLLDIYVNYYGWTYEQFEDYYMKTTPREDNDTFTKKNLYEEMIKSPCTTAMVYSIYGGYFEDLYNQSKLMLGDKFNPIEFHKVILDSAPGYIETIRKQVNKYILEKMFTK